MATDVQKSNQGVEGTLERLTNLHYDSAKLWTGWHLAIEVFIYLAGLVAVFAAWLPMEYPVVPLVLILVTLWVSARAESCKDVAEGLKRQHEFWQGFGIAPSRSSLADLRARVEKCLPSDLDSLLREGLKFSSEKPRSSERVLENLCESAWWSAQLAGWCSDRLKELFIGSVVVAVVMLMVVAASVSGKPVGTATAKCVSSTLAFLISVGVLKSWLAFAKFSREASSFDTEAQNLLKQGSVPPQEAQRLLSQYQLLRATSPLIPTWVWKKRRKILNETWDELKRPTS